MTGSTARKLYQQCLLLNMFDDCRAAQGFWPLLADVVCSALKQQISYGSTPLQRSAPFYAEIAWSPKLARVFAVIALGAGLITAAVADRDKPKDPESWILRHAEHRFWFPTTLPPPSCSEGR
jgi:hypothetical protein